MNAQCHIVVMFTKSIKHTIFYEFILFASSMFATVHTVCCYPKMWVHFKLVDAIC